MKNKQLKLLLLLLERAAMELRPGKRANREEAEIEEDLATKKKKLSSRINYDALSQMYGEEKQQTQLEQILAQ